MIVLRNAMLVVIFGAMSSIQYNNHMSAPWQDLELAEAKYQVSSIPVPRGVTYVHSGKVKSSYGVPSKSYGSGYIGQGYGIPKGIPLYRWDAIRPKGKGAHHGKHGHHGKGGHHHHHHHHHHGKGVVHIIKPAYVKPAYVKPAYTKPAYVHPVSTAAISSGYGSSAGSSQGTTSHSGYSISSGAFSSPNKGQASAYGLTNKKPFTAFKPFKGKTPSTIEEVDVVGGSPPKEEKPATGGELVVTPAVAAPVPEIAPPAEIVAPAVVEVAPVVVEVVAPPAPEIVPAEEPLSAEVAAGAAEPLSAEEVEPVSGEVAQVAAEPVVQEPLVPEVVTHPVDGPEIGVIEAIVEIVETATEVVNAPAEGEAESATEVGGKDPQGEENEIKEGKEEEEETKADGQNGANKESEEEGGNNNSDER